MKKIIKNRIFIVIICGIIFTSLGVYGATKYQASEISYNPSNGESTNVNDALNELYDKMNNSCKNKKYLLESREYKTGISIYWAGKEWYVIKDNGPNTTLILKENYGTGIYGNSIVFENSVAYEKLNNDFIIENKEIQDAIDEGVLISQGLNENKEYYIRLPEQTELTLDIPNISGTPFWTKTENEGGLYFGSSNGNVGYAYSVSSTSGYRGMTGQCYSGCSNSDLKKELNTNLKSISYISPTTSTVVDKYTEATEYSSSEVSNTGSGCGTFNVCKISGIKSEYTCNETYRLYASSGKCTSKTVYNLSTASLIGYRPVITVSEV